MTSVAHDHHFAGTLVEMVVRKVNASPERLAAVLSMAGESRPVDDLCDPAGWSSYEEFRALLESTSEILGEESLVGLADVVVDPTMPEIHALMLSLGSPDALFAAIMNAGGASMAPVCRVTGEADGQGTWVVRQAFRDGFAPFRAYCAFTRGMLAGIPRLFGHSAHVVEETCECDGAPCCRFRIEWDGSEGSSREFLEGKIRVLEAQLSAQQATVSDLISGESLSAVLSRIIDAAARTVNAPWFILALEGSDPSTRQVYARGLPQDRAEEIAAQLDARTIEDDPSRLVVQIASKRRHYGRLVAMNPGGGFFPQQLSVLQAYMGLAAAALDSASALEESQRQAETARVLLSLSVSLAHIADSTEMAATLANAIPAVTGCDRSIVVLNDEQNQVARVAAACGFADDVTTWLLSLEVRLPTVPEDEVTFYGEQEACASPLLREIMQRTGSAAFAVVPIVVDTEHAGFVVADVADRPQRLLNDDELRERLLGLASQAATAVRNACLLEKVRYQALHDSLTGLANRELIFDRAEHMLSRSRRSGAPTAALFIDLDEFKGVNDAFGHDAGDELLEIVAGRLQSVLRTSDTLGRLGGDEFVVLLEYSSLAQGPESTAQRILDALREPATLHRAGGMTVSVKASIGIASDTFGSAPDLLRDADRALYQAKAAGKNRFCAFESRTHVSQSG